MMQKISSGNCAMLLMKYEINGAQNSCIIGESILEQSTNYQRKDCLKYAKWLGLAPCSITLFSVFYCPHS